MSASTVHKLSSSNNNGDAWDLVWDAHQRTQLPTVLSLPKRAIQQSSEQCKNFSCYSYSNRQLISLRTHIGTIKGIWFSQKESKSGWQHHVISSQNKKWNTTFIARYLAILLVHCKLKNKARANAKPLGKSAEEQSNIKKAFCKLYKIYKPCLRAHQVQELANMNKKYCTSSLDYQLKGVLLQHSFKWLTFAPNRNVCPVCEDQYTMRVQMGKRILQGRMNKLLLLTKMVWRLELFPSQIIMDATVFNLTARGLLTAKAASCVNSMWQQVNQRSKWPVSGVCETVQSASADASAHLKWISISPFILLWNRWQGRRVKRSKPYKERKKRLMLQKKRFWGAWNTTRIWPSSTNPCLIGRRRCSWMMSRRTKMEGIVQMRMSLEIKMKAGSMKMMVAWLEITILVFRMSSQGRQWPYFMITQFAQMGMCPGLFSRASSQLRILMLMWTIRRQQQAGGLCLLCRRGRNCAPGLMEHGKSRLEGRMVLIKPHLRVCSWGIRTLVTDIRTISNCCRSRNPKDQEHHLLLPMSCRLWGHGRGHMHWQIVITKPLQVLRWRRYLFDFH